MDQKEPIPSCQDEGFGKKFRAWVQTVGIIIASILAFLWGVYSFIYKEIIIPKSAPVNITLNLSLQKSGINVNRANGNEKPLSAIELKIAATNPSTRSIYLLPSYFIVYGGKVAKSYYLNEDKLSDVIISSKSNYFIQKHSLIISRTVIAYGNLLNYDALYPHEVEAKTFVFHVPKGEYDIIEIYATIPSVTKNKSGLRLEWVYDKANKQLNPKIYYKPPNYWLSWLFRKESEEREFAKRDDKGDLINEGDLKLAEKLEFQSASSMSMISLWEASKIDGSKPTKAKAD
jgi:hypothetical protein